MRLTYNRRWFWILSWILLLLMASFFAFRVLLLDEPGRSVLWLSEKVGPLLPLFVILIVLTVLRPTLSTFLEARKRARGISVVISPKVQAQRVRGWASPIPWPVWVVLSFWCLLLLFAWTNALPRLFFGYRGALGQGLSVAWAQEVGPDGRYLALDAERSEGGRCLALVERASGKTTTFALPGSIEAMAWSPDGHLLAVSGGDFLKTLDVASGRMNSLNRPGLIAMAFHPGGALWTLAEDGLWLWDPRTRASSKLMDKQIVCLKAGTYQVAPISMALSPSGNRLALDYGQQIRVLETSLFKQAAFWDVPRDSGKEIRFSSDDRLLLAARPADEKAFSIQVLDALHGKVLSRIEGVQWDARSMEHLDVSKDGARLAIRRSDHSVAVWSFETQRWIWSAPDPTRDGERAPRFSPDGKDVTTVGYSDPCLFSKTGSPVRRWRI